MEFAISWLILGLRTANERRRYFVTTSSIAGRKPRISPVSTFIIGSHRPYRSNTTTLDLWWWSWLYIEVLLKRTWNHMERVKRYQINQKVHIAIGHVQANGGVLHITTYENDSELVYHEGTVWAVWTRKKLPTNQEMSLETDMITFNFLFPFRNTYLWYRIKPTPIKIAY